MHRTEPVAARKLARGHARSAEALQRVVVVGLFVEVVEVVLSEVVNVGIIERGIVFQGRCRAACLAECLDLSAELGGIFGPTMLQFAEVVFRHMDRAKLMSGQVAGKKGIRTQRGRTGHLCPQVVGDGVSFQTRDWYGKAPHSAKSPVAL